MLLYSKVKSVIGSGFSFNLSFSIVSGLGIGFIGANCKSYTIAESIFVLRSKTWVLYSFITLLCSLISLYFLLKAFARLFDLLARYISLK
jgi:ABC-type antimicrobial peptide transport system permease subunit